MKDFDTAVQNIRKSDERNCKMSHEEMMKIYGLFKQSTIGDNTHNKPDSSKKDQTDKWQSWTQCKGKPQEQAQKEYVCMARDLLKKYKCDDLANF